MVMIDGDDSLTAIREAITEFGTGIHKSTPRDYST